jgi:hypothetical protein
VSRVRGAIDPNEIDRSFTLNQMIEKSPLILSAPVKDYGVMCEVKGRNNAGKDENR